MGSGSVELDGVIKFNGVPYKSPSAINDASLFKELEQWRSYLRFWKLVGQGKDNVGYGNLSRKVPLKVADGKLEVIITGADTGKLVRLGIENYVLVEEISPEMNEVYHSRFGDGKNETKPSSETMTHFGVYNALPDTNFVFHAHSPSLWNARHALNIPTTPEQAKYGTPELYFAIKQLLAEPDVAKKKIVALGGHPPGIVTWGRTASEAGLSMLVYQAMSSPVSAYQHMRENFEQPIGRRI